MAGNNIHSEAAALANKGLNVSVITDGKQTLIHKTDGVTVYQLKFGTTKLYYLFFIVKSIYTAWKINNKNKIHIIHAQWAVVAGFVSVLTAKILKIPSIVTCRGFDVNYSQDHPEYGANTSLVPRFFVRFTLKYVDHIICISNRLKENIKKLWGIERENINVVYPAIADSFLKESAHINAPNRLPVILTVAGLRKIKRIEDVIKALELLRGRGIMFEYLVAGLPLDNYDNLQLLVKNSIIKDSVKFLEHIKRDELISIYDRADLCVYPSVLEGFGRSFLEGAARKKPIILTSASGCSEVIRHMETGIIVPPNAPESIANAIELIITEKDLAKKIGDNGYRYLVENHTMEIHAENMMRIYSTIQPI